MPEVGGGLLGVFGDSVPGQEEEFERWYEDEHLYERSAIEGFLFSRRYISLEGQNQSLVLYEVTKPEVLHSEAYLVESRGRNRQPRLVGGGPASSGHSSGWSAKRPRRSTRRSWTSGT